MTYNVGDKKITLTVTVTKADDGTLTLTDTYADGDGDNNDSITNKYETGKQSHPHHLPWFRSYH